MRSHSWKFKQDKCIAISFNYLKNNDALQNASMQSVINNKPYYATKAYTSCSCKVWRSGKYILGNMIVCENSISTDTGLYK